MFSEIGPATRLSLSDRRTLYELLERHYEHVSWMQFEADLAEKDAVIRTLARSNGNMSRAADLLGVSRPTLYDLLNRFGLKEAAR